MIETQLQKQPLYTWRYSWNPSAHTKPWFQHNFQAPCNRFFLSALLSRCFLAPILRHFPDGQLLLFSKLLFASLYICICLVHLELWGTFVALCCASELCRLWVFWTMLCGLHLVLTFRTSAILWHNETCQNPFEEQSFLYFPCSGALWRNGTPQV